MRIKSTFLTLFLFLTFIVLPIKNSIAGGSEILDILPTDSPAETAIVGFFDLRDRESFMQVTNIDSGPTGQVFHIQIFDVGNNCNENNFFDSYTPNDTHVYNLRNIQTNDGNPPGVILPDDAYGIFFLGVVDNNNPILIGNLRILDDNGYEYRTNLVGVEESDGVADNSFFATFNFNTIGGVTLSDIAVFTSSADLDSEEFEFQNILDVWFLVDVNIYDLNENAFSCRNVIFSCVDQDNPLLEALLEEVASGDDDDDSANVASFEYGINNAIPHSKGEELLCPGNNIEEGFVRLEFLKRGDESDEESILFVGLNNGNGRGSMDVHITQSSETPLSGNGGGGG